MPKIPPPTWLSTAVAEYSHSWLFGTLGSMDQTALTTAFSVKLLRTFCNIQCIAPVYASLKFYSNAMSKCCERLVSLKFGQKAKFDKGIMIRNALIFTIFSWPYIKYMLYNELQIVILMIVTWDCKIFTKRCRTVSNEHRRASACHMTYITPAKLGNRESRSGNVAHTHATHFVEIGKVTHLM